MTLPPELAPYATLFAEAGSRHGVDPLLLAAICSRESRGGRTLTPSGPGGTGDHGHGRGLMQIDDRAHATWIASHDWQDAAVNIDHGAEILAGMMRVFPANLRAAIAAYNCGPGNVRRALLGHHDEDFYTTGGNYSADVLRRRDDFRAAAQMNLIHEPPRNA